MNEIPADVQKLADEVTYWEGRCREAWKINDKLGNDLVTLFVQKQEIRDTLQGEIEERSQLEEKLIALHRRWINEEKASPDIDRAFGEMRRIVRGEA